MAAGNTSFTIRSGSHKFREATQTNGYASLVNNWHKNVYDQLDVHYMARSMCPTGRRYLPLWVRSIPTTRAEAVRSLRLKRPLRRRSLTLVTANVQSAVSS